MHTQKSLFKGALQRDGLFYALFMCHAQPMHTEARSVRANPERAPPARQHKPSRTCCRYSCTVSLRWMLIWVPRPRRGPCVSSLMAKLPEALDSQMYLHAERGWGEKCGVGGWLAYVGLGAGWPSDRVPACVCMCVHGWLGGRVVVGMEGQQWRRHGLF